MTIVIDACEDHTVWTGPGAGGTLSTSTTRKEGAASVQFDNVPPGIGGILQRPSLSVDLSEYTLNGGLRFWLYVDAPSPWRPTIIMTDNQGAWIWQDIMSKTGFLGSPVLADLQVGWNDVFLRFNQTRYTAGASRPAGATKPGTISNFRLDFDHTASTIMGRIDYLRAEQRMDIRTALDELIIRQAGLSITTPIAISIKKAHKYMAPQEATVPETPCFMNSWQLVEHEMGHGRGSVKEIYVVNSQLFVKDADLERGADIATAFHVAFVTDLEDGDLTLAGTVVKVSFRDGLGAALVDFPNRAGYIGVNYFLNLLLTK